MALISGLPRAADVTALDYSKFATLSRRDFRQFLAQYPAIRDQIAALASKRRAVQAAADFQTAEHSVNISPTVVGLPSIIVGDAESGQDEGEFANLNQCPRRKSQKSEEAIFAARDQQLLHARKPVKPNATKPTSTR